MILLDSSVLVALTQDEHKHRKALLQLISDFRLQGQQPCIAQQCVFEFYVVASRPKNVNGLGLKPSASMRYVEHYWSIFRVDDQEVCNLLEPWSHVVETYRVSGRPAHDARLVAWMLANGVGRILTLNPKDFVRYQPQIEVLTVDAP